MRAPLLWVTVWLGVIVTVGVTGAPGLTSVGVIGIVGGCEAGPGLTGGVPGVITLLGVTSGVSGACSGLTTTGVGVRVGSVIVVEGVSALLLAIGVTVMTRVTKITGVSEIHLE